MDIVEVNKVMNGIIDVDRDKFFKVSNYTMYTATRGHSVNSDRSDSISFRVIAHGIHYQECNNGTLP